MLNCSVVLVPRRCFTLILSHESQSPPKSLRSDSKALNRRLLRAFHLEFFRGYSLYPARVLVQPSQTADSAQGVSPSFCFVFLRSLSLSLRVSSCLFVSLRCLCVSACLPAGLPVCLSIYQSISIYRSICLSVYLSIYLSILSLCLSIYPPVYLFMLIYSNLYLLPCLSICLSIYLHVEHQLPGFYKRIKSA